MKILLGVDRLGHGGISRVCENIAIALYSKGYDVKVVCGKCEKNIPVPVIRCNYSERLNQSDIMDVLRIIKEYKPDIFHSHYFPMDLCGALTHFLGIKHVMHAHGINHQNWRFGLKNILSLLRADVGEFVGAHFSDKIIAISNYMKEVIKKKCRVEENKIEIVYNFIDTKKFNPSIEGNLVRERLRIGPEDVVLLYVAGIAPVKRQDLLIDCMSHIIKIRKNVKLLLVGGVGKTIIQYKQAIMDKVRRLNLENYVVFCGYVDDKELPNYYAASDIFVSTSSWEGFGLPFVEAMACAKPVVGFDRCAISELIINEYNGYKVRYPNVKEMASRIIGLIEDEKKRKEFGRNGRKMVEEKFDVAKNIKNIIRIYEGLV